MALDPNPSSASTAAPPPQPGRSPRRRPLDRVQLALVAGAAVMTLIVLAAGVWLIRSLTPAASHPAAAAPSETPYPAFVIRRTLTPAAAAGAETAFPATIWPPAGGQIVAVAEASVTTAAPPAAAPPQTLAPGLPLSGSAAAGSPPALLSPAAPPAITLPASPAPAGAAAYTLIGRLLPPPGELFRAVAEYSGYAYALTRAGRLHVYDLTQMTPTQELQAYAQPLRTLELKNGAGLLRLDQALYAFGPSGIEIIDLSQPDQPALLGWMKDLQATSLLSANQRLYALGQGIIIVYDLTQPLHPTWVQKVHMSADANNFSGVIAQDRLYVSQYWFNGVKTRSLLEVYRLTLTGEIKAVQRIDTGELAYQMHRLDDKLIRCTSTDVEVWDLSDPNYPRFQEDAPSPARGCAQDGENILTQGAVFTLQAGRLKPLAAFEPRAGLTAPPTFFEASPYGAAAGGGYVYLAQPDQVLILAGK